MADRVTRRWKFAQIMTITTQSPLSLLSAPPKRSLSDEVVDRLREAIISGAMPQGERLREETLAETLQVSRGPIREALTKLEREGLVAISPNRGATVARLSREDLDEVYSLRFAMESLAVRLSAKTADAACLAEMESCVHKMGDALTHGADAIRKTAELDVRFHKKLVQSCGHKLLLRHWTELRPQIHWLLLQRNISDPDFRDYAVSTHSIILNAIRDHDESRALHELDQHLRGSYTRVAGSYTKTKP